MQKKEKKLCKKSSTSVTAHEYNGVSQGIPPSPPPGGGGGGGQRAFLHYSTIAFAPSTLFAKKNRIFLKDFSRLRASSVIETLQKKVKKYLKKD
jgi:hypothetical protein